MFVSGWYIQLEGAPPVAPPGISLILRDPASFEQLVKAIMLGIIGLQVQPVRRPLTS